MLQIGSKAIKHWFPEFPREPKDADFAVECESNSCVVGGTRFEYLHNPVILEWNASNFSTVLSPTGILTLKMSHVFWAKGKDLDKTLFDITFLVEKGVVHDQSLFDALVEFWTSKFGPVQKSNLALSKDEFFDNSVNSKQPIEHDEIHEILSDTPAYIQTLKDGCEVETDPEKFAKLPFTEKIRIPQEEIMAMAAERFQGLPFRKRYDMMLKKFLVNHAPMYMAVFMLLNWRVVQKCPFDFMSKINNVLIERGITPLC